MSREIKKALERSIPVFLGYIVLGMAYGILMQQAGYGFWWCLATSIFVYAGSMQFALIGFLGTPVSLITVAITTLSINSRHMFYGLSFIDAFKKMGKRYIYMIASLTDETYPLLFQDDYGDLDTNKCRFYISLFDQFYWVLGSCMGALLGNVLPFNTEGLDFAMTALFVVILTEQLINAKSKLPAIIGGTCGIISLVILGPSKFLLPSLIATVVFLLGGKTFILKKEEA